MDRDDERETRVEYRGTGFYVGLFAIILFGLVLFILAVQNTQEVEVRFLGFEFSFPLFAIAIGAALLAVIIDELIGLMWRRQRRIRLEERAELQRLRAAGARPAEEPTYTTAAEPTPEAETSASEEEPSVGDEEPPPSPGIGHPGDEPDQGAPGTT